MYKYIALVHDHSALPQIRPMLRTTLHLVLKVRLSQLGGQAQLKVPHMPHGEQIGLHLIIDRDYLSFICVTIY